MIYAQHLGKRLSTSLIGVGHCRTSVASGKKSLQTRFFNMTVNGEPRGVKRKLHGRDFYQSIGSPKFILAPMVDQSEFAWRMLTRSFMTPEDNRSLLAYTPMFHARMFAETPKYRQHHFQPHHSPLCSPSEENYAAPLSPDDTHLDGNPDMDRPLFVQFCANEPDDFLTAAQYVAPYCDAVDLNLGCPQGIARKGRYGAFLQEDWPTIEKLISNLHENLSVPVTAKFRIQESNEKTLAYAKMILSAGASIITVHGRQREQKGHNTGLADWSVIRYLRENLPPETVIFANGNILQHEDIQPCLEATGADGVMSAEGNLYDPSIFSTPPPVGSEGREYWRGSDGKGGWRMDAALRRYIDIVHRHVLGQEPPERPELYIPADGPLLPSSETNAHTNGTSQPGTTPQTEPATDGSPATKKQKRKEQRAGSITPGKRQERELDPNLTAMQAHLFHMLRPLVARHTHIRDALARIRAGDIAAFERILSMVEAVVAEGVAEYAAGRGEANVVNGHGGGAGATPSGPNGSTGITNDQSSGQRAAEQLDPHLSSLAAVQRCKRPWFICQPYVRPLPKEALEKGALSISKKEKKRLAALEEEARAAERAGIGAEGRVEAQVVGELGNSVEGGDRKRKRSDGPEDGDKDVGKREIIEVPRDGLVCG